MTRYDIDDGIPTLAAALSEHLSADELKVLASLTNTPATDPEGRARGAHLPVP